MADPYRHMRAEIVVRNPGLIGATGRLRREVLERRAAAAAALADADERLRQAADDRRDAVARIRACNRALVGTGQVVASDGTRRQYLWRRADTVEDPLPDAGALAVVSGEALRDALVDLLAVVGRPLSVREAVRLLAAHGLRPPGRASQTVSNALGVEIRNGVVRRIARGWYAPR